MIKMNQDRLKRNIVAIGLFAAVSLLIAGIVLIRNAHGRVERTMGILMKECPNLSEIKDLDMENYKEKVETNWRKRTFETSGVLKSNQPVFYLLKEFEPNSPNNPFPIKYSEFESFRDLTTGIAFKTVFNNQSSYSTVEFSPKLPKKLYVEDEINKYCANGIVIVDGRLYDESKLQADSIGKLVQEMDFRLINAKNEMEKFGAFLDSYAARVPQSTDQEKKRMLNDVQRKETEMKEQLNSLEVMNQFCRISDKLRSYDSTTTEYIQNNKSLAVQLGKLKIDLMAVTAQPYNNNSGAGTGAGTGIVVVDLPTSGPVETTNQVSQLPDISLAAREWCQAHYPDLFGKYAASKEEVDSAGLEATNLEYALMQYNQLNKQIVDAYAKWNAVKVEPELSLDEQETCRKTFPNWFSDYTNRLNALNRAKKSGTQDEWETAVSQFNTSCKQIRQLGKDPLPVPEAELGMETLKWCRVYQPDLFNRYENGLSSIDNAVTIQEKKNAILQYNQVNQEISRKKNAYYSNPNPTKEADLSSTIISFAEENCPEHLETYNSAKTHIRNLNLIIRRLESNGGSASDRLRRQDELNTWIVEFNKARMEIMYLNLTSQ